MYCSNCGKPIEKEDKYCRHCGKENKYYNGDNIEADYLNSYMSNIKPNQTSSDEIYGSSGVGYNNPRPIHMNSSVSSSHESQALGIWAIVLCSLGGSWIGMILAIIGLCTYKEETGKKKCKIALIILVAWLVIGFIIGFAMGINN